MRHRFPQSRLGTPPPFNRRASANSAVQGTAIALPIVDATVDRVGRGAADRCRRPAPRASAPPLVFRLRPALDSVACGRVSNATVLIVEDDDDIRLLVTVLLER